MSVRFIGNGFDVGAACAGATVSVGDPRSSFVLEALYPIFGNEQTWSNRVVEACRAMPTGPHTFTVIEKPPPTAKLKRSKFGNNAVLFEGDKRGHTTFFGIGRRFGRIEATWWMVHGDFPMHWTVQDWTGRLQPTVRKKKMKGGGHRVQEAILLLPACKELLASVPKYRRIDCAEAILIACGAALACREASVIAKMKSPQAE